MCQNKDLELLKAFMRQWEWCESSKDHLNESGKKKYQWYKEVGSILSSKLTHLGFQGGK